MVKKLHYIKEDYSGDIEKYCLKTYKKFYPDYEFLAWRPGSSPLKILYDNGGIFIGPNILALNHIPENLMDKPFIMFDNRFETTEVRFSVCYADEPNSRLFLEFMEKGIYQTLEKKGFDNHYKVGLAEENYELDELRIINRYFLGFDKAYYDLYDSALLDMNIHFDISENTNLHYLIINDNIDPNKLFSVSENFGKMKYEDGSDHTLLLINNCSPARYDLVSRMTALLLYLCTTPNKHFNIINTGNTSSETVNKITAEYIGRKYDNLRSCERLI